jgi:hypothetical protein
LDCDWSRPLNTRFMIWARRGTLVISVLAFAWVMWNGFSSGFELPSGLGLRFVVAVPLSILGLACGAVSWSHLAGTPKRHGFAAFGGSLPLRHLPLGGFGQIAGLAGLSMTSGTSKRRAAQAGPLFLMTTALGAGLAAAPMLWSSESPLVLRIGVGLAIGFAVLVMFQGRRALRLLGDKFSFAAGSEGIPLVRPILWSTLAAIGTAAAFSVLMQGPANIMQGIGGFASAWLSGFLFVIAPAGLGAREAVLVALWPEVDPAVVVSISLLHRLSTFLAEGLLLVVGLVLSRGTAENVQRSSG